MLALYLILTLFLSPDPIEEIHFGKGGGIAGMISHYIIDSEGSFYQYNPFTEERSLIRTITKGEVTRLWEKASQEEIRKLEIKKPGNTYKFVQIVSSGKSQKLVWSGKSPNNSLHLFYKELNMLRQIKE